MPWMALVIQIFKLIFPFRIVYLPQERRSEQELVQRQLLIKCQRDRKRYPLHASDRFFFALCAHFLPKHKLKRSCFLLTPNTLLSFHRALVKRKYSILFGSKRKKPGPKGPAPELIRYVVECKRLNPYYGCERIALHAIRDLGIPVTHQAVRRILRKHLPPSPRHPGGPSWWTFYANTKESLWALDLFRVESVFLKSYWVMVVMDVWSRKIIGFAAQRAPVYGEDICYMFNRIARGHSKPKYLSTDHDPLFKFHQWQANLRILDISIKKSIPHVPLSHPFIERVIGTTRREFLDQTLIWNQRDLEQKLEKFKDYYNQHRVHSSLGPITPSQKRGESNLVVPNTGKPRWQPFCGGLFHVFSRKP